MKNLTPIGKFEILNINALVGHINRTAKCDFIKVEYRKLEGAITAMFTIYGKVTSMYYEDTAIAFLDGIYIWASDNEN